MKNSVTTLCLLLAGVAFDISYGGLNEYRYTLDKAIDLPLSDEYETKFWRDVAINGLNEKLNFQLRTNKAKNLILFLGDGMSFPTIAAARIYKGQQNQRTGENSKLSFEYFPFTGLSKTYCVDKQVADSACSATAYLGGVKANYGTLGVTAAVPYGNCTQNMDPKNHVDSILMWAQAAGKGTGLVTTAAITDASPAGGYCHSASRTWQSDKDLYDEDIDPKMCPDIAQQLIRQKPGLDAKVILGGGWRKFLPEIKKNFEWGIGPGERLDGADLIEEWLEDKKIRNKSATFKYDRKGLLEKDTVNSDYIFGLFQPKDMLYHLDEESNLQPTLEEMTEVAIERLKREPNGYYLFIEGALIDKAHHRTWAHRALDETVEFSKAIDRALKLTNEEDTLIVVTADHAHTMSLNGYPERGNNILGLSTSENKTYATLGYANGPSAPLYKDGEHDYSKDDMYNDTFVYPSLIELIDETHGGDDVGVYARGPWAHLFTGVYEQNLIPHLMGYAAGIGPAAGIRKDPHSNKINKIANSASSLVFGSSMSLVIIVTVQLILFLKSLL